MSNKKEFSVKKELVVKSNRLIEASYRLSLVEQQIVMFAICRSREEERGLSPDTHVTIRAAEFAAQFGTNEANVYKQLRDAMTSLFSREVRIRDTDPKTGKPRVIDTRWISDKAYIDGEGEIQITFAPRMIPFITRLEPEFTKYRLDKIGNMTSTHAIRLYELLVQYLTVGKREIEISWLKEILQLENEYPRLFDFKKWVIDVAVTQINEHSNIYVSYTQCKTGRAVTHLIFEIKAKEQIKKLMLVAKTPVISARGSDARANPGESQTEFNRRMAVRG